MPCFFTFTKIVCCQQTKTLMAETLLSISSTYLGSLGQPDSKQDCFYLISKDMYKAWQRVATVTDHVNAS